MTPNHQQIIETLERLMDEWLGYPDADHLRDAIEIVRKDMEGVK